MATIPHSTTDLDRLLVALVSDLKATERAADGLSDGLAFDVGILLYQARAAIQDVRDILDALPPFSRYDAEPRSATSAAGTVQVY
jgi:hypothetical protein